LVGGVQAHKGALVFEDVVKRMEGSGLRWTAYGGGEPELLARLRRLPRVRIRGYYRSGTLPRLLRRDRVDVALLLSIVPESYSLVLDECVSAGVLVLAFDLGAVGERLPQLEAGSLVRLEEGAEGVVRALKRATLPPP
jgi:glycosyl transferase family 1